MYSNSCFSWAVLLLFPPPQSITVQTWKCFYYICLVLSTLKGWSRFNFLPIIGLFPSCFSAVGSVSLPLTCLSNFWPVIVGFRNLVEEFCCCMGCSLIPLKISTNNWNNTEFLCKFMFSVQDLKLLFFFLLEGSPSFVFIEISKTYYKLHRIQWNLDFHFASVVDFRCVFSLYVFPQCVTPGYAGNQAKFSWPYCIALLFWLR